MATGGCWGLKKMSEMNSGPLRIRLDTTVNSNPERQIDMKAPYAEVTTKPPAINVEKRDNGELILTSPYPPLGGAGG